MTAEPTMETMDSLKAELDFYRQNQSTVEREIRLLIEDNRKLSQQVGVLLRERLAAARAADAGTADGVNQQVNMITKERDSLHVLWQSSQKTIEALEAELRAYHESGEAEYQNPVGGRRDLELKLESSLADYLEVENKLKNLNMKHKTLEKEVAAKDNEIASYKERGKELDRKIEELNHVLEEHRIELAVEKTKNEDLRTQLTFFQKENVNLVKKEAEAKAKVAEALQLFDVVSTQKDEAYKKIAEITAESCKIKQELQIVQSETENAFRIGLDEVKDRYNEKVADMLAHIRNLDAELVEKGLMLNKTMRELKILQTTNEEYSRERDESAKTRDPRLAAAEQRVEALCQELLSSERRNIQLSCDKQSVMIDLQRTQEVCSREAARRDWEEQMLRSEVDELRLQVRNLQSSLDETHEMVGKLQALLAARNELHEKMLSSKQEEFEELNKHLENQTALSKKWKDTYVQVTQKLKKRLEHLMKENHALRGVTGSRHRDVTDASKCDSTVSDSSRRSRSSSAT